MTPAFGPTSGPARAGFSLHSMRARLSGALTLVVAMLLIGADFGLTDYAHRSALQRADRSLSESLATVEAALRNESAEVPLLQESEEHEEGKAAARQPPAPSPAAEALRESQTELDGEQTVVLIREERGSGEWGSAGASVLRSGHLGAPDWRLRSVAGFRAEAAKYDIIVGAPWAQTAAALQSQARLLAVLTLLIVPITAAGAWLLVGGTLHPIDQLVRQALEQGRKTGVTGKLHLHTPSSDAEIVRLVDTLNRLLDSAMEASEERARFYTAASHELRTPLQVLAGRAELALSRDRSAEEYRSSLVEVQEQTEKLVALVQSLLLLNRIERQGGAPPLSAKAAERVDIAECCARQAEALQEQIAARNLDWWQHVKTASAAGDSPARLVTAAAVSHVEILLRNLMENAARYTPAGGTVRVVLRESDDHSALLLEIANEVGPEAFAGSDPGRLFEPFYRPDASRTSETGGNGLGLSICRAIADLNGWDLWLRHEGGWLVATVAFPKAAATAA